MAKIASYPVLNFTGGIRRDAGPFELQKNELLNARNIVIDERGRARIRLGSQQLGQTLTGVIENSFHYSRRTGTVSASVDQLIVNNRANPTVFSQLLGTKTTVAVATSDTTITVTSTTGFAASGTIEIDGDLVAYTGVTATTFTGCSGIAFAHVLGAPVHQWSTITQGGSYSLDGRLGIYYAMMGSTLYISSGGGSLANFKSYDGTTMSDVAVSLPLLFLVNYHDRLMGAGAGQNGSSPRKVTYSARGDATDWSSAGGAGNFDVNDQLGERIVALKVFKDYLGIFKNNSVFTYDEIELKQRLTGVGAYNDKCIQEINGILYVIGPNGVYETNLFSAKEIGKPVKEYLDTFAASLDSVISSITQNVFTWAVKDSFFIWLSSVTAPTSQEDIVLEYNTKTKSWATHTNGFTNFAHAKTFFAFKFGDSSINIASGTFAGDEDGKVWKLYENFYRNTSSTGSVIGGDIYVDLRSNTGTPIPASFETPMYDLTHPELFKKFNRLRVLAESGQWSIEYRVENEQGITAYMPLGTVARTNTTLPFPSEAQGWRCGFRVSGVNTNGNSIFNGFVFEETEVLPRP